jgi:hypothetical protein
MRETEQPISMHHVPQCETYFRIYDLEAGKMSQPVHLGGCSSSKNAKEHPRKRLRESCEKKR